MGLMALVGVVALVPDSLVMVDYINKRRLRETRDSGRILLKSVLAAGTARSRSIMLTSLTTFFGLIPLVFEKSTQAQFLIPMAVSLAFGVMFATIVTLFMIPGINYADPGGCAPAAGKVVAARPRAGDRRQIAPGRSERGNGGIGHRRRRCASSPDIAIIRIIKLIQARAGSARPVPPYRDPLGEEHAARYPRSGCDRGAAASRTRARSGCGGCRV
ncbi:MAG: efflux RND transporter permease subunit [Gammaproteobacteria bacterium]|nr:efflux RND transporter permease subunit [Gammaproteobacteria bacterium]